MSTSTCWSCRSLFRHRLRAQISFLQQSRRPASTKGRPSLSWYNDTTAPTSTQLEAAEKFFLTHQPRKLWTATEWRKHNDEENTSLGLIPEVAFLGRSNVGKSSLLNALLISPALNHVGPRPGKTTTMHAWAVSPTDPKTGGAVKGSKGDMITKCAVLDMPGYGHASHDDWGEEILSYLKNRKQLKRAFVLVDGRHGLKSGDVTMLKLLRKQGISAQIVVSKCDKTSTIEGSELVQNLWENIQETVNGPGLGLLGEVLVVGSLGDGRKNDSVHYNNMRGVHEVQWAVLRATGLDEYAVTIASSAYAKATTSTPQIKGGEAISAATSTDSTLTRMHPAPVPLKSPSPPPPEVPFSWPAKIRQPSSGISEMSTIPISPPPRTINPMISPPLPSEVVPNFAGQELDVMSMVPPQQLNRRDASSRTDTRTEASPRPFERPRQTDVWVSDVDGRPFADHMLGADYSLRDSPPVPRRRSPPAPERQPIRKPAESSGAWTGSAVGGMADLEALSSRSAGGRRPTPSPPSKKSNSKTPLRGHPRVKVKKSVNYENVSSQEVEKPNEVWTGSAVGGMADLEAMMARSSGPSPAAKKPGQKRRR